MSLDLAELDRIVITEEARKKAATKPVNSRVEGGTVRWLMNPDAVDGFHDSVMPLFNQAKTLGEAARLVRVLDYSEGTDVRSLPREYLSSLSEQLGRGPVTFDDIQTVPRDEADTGYKRLELRERYHEGSYNQGRRNPANDALEALKLGEMELVAQLRPQVEERVGVLSQELDRLRGFLASTDPKAIGKHTGKVVKRAGQLELDETHV